MIWLWLSVLTAAVTTILVIKLIHAQGLESHRVLDAELMDERINQLIENFADYKKKVDTLVIKAGFKI